MVLYCILRAMWHAVSDTSAETLPAEFLAGVADPVKKCQERTSSFLFLVVRPGAPSSFLLLVAMPFVTKHRGALGEPPCSSVRNRVRLWEITFACEPFILSVPEHMVYGFLLGHMEFSNLFVGMEVNTVQPSGLVALFLSMLAARLNNKSVMLQDRLCSSDLQLCV